MERAGLYRVALPVSLGLPVGGMTLAYDAQTGRLRALIADAGCPPSCVPGTSAFMGSALSVPASGCGKVTRDKSRRPDRAAIRGAALVGAEEQRPGLGGAGWAADADLTLSPSASFGYPGQATASPAGCVGSLPNVHPLIGVRAVLRRVCRHRRSKLCRSGEEPRRVVSGWPPRLS